MIFSSLLSIPTGWIKLTPVGSCSNVFYYCYDYYYYCYSSVGWDAGTGNNSELGSLLIWFDYSGSGWDFQGTEFYEELVAFIAALGLT